MKKSFSSVIMSLLLVLVISFGVTFLLLPLLKNRRTYSETSCLNDRITSNMSMTEIANIYVENNSTVAIICSGEYGREGDIAEFLGSGVCVASNGYTVKLDGEEYTASKGSYIATNYHVIDLVDKKEYSNVEITVISEDEQEYEAQVLWYDKDTDVAILYTEENFNYIEMKDKVVECSEEEHYNIEDVFIIGTPLNLAYLNRVTCGNIATNHAQYMTTLDTIFVSTNNGLDYTFNQQTNSRYYYNVVSNIYEDVIDINVDITGGNSGGGCFDKEGYLIGLATLGTDVDATGGVPMNGVVPIYPIMKVLDKVILNKETKADKKIYTLDSMDIEGIDVFEAIQCSSTMINADENDYYFLDGEFYLSQSYKTAFSMREEGYYVLNTGTRYAKLKNHIIKSCTYNGETIDILTRNDLIYLLLRMNEGDSLKFNFKGITSATITL